MEDFAPIHSNETLQWYMIPKAIFKVRVTLWNYIVWKNGYMICLMFFSW